MRQPAKAGQRRKAARRSSEALVPAKRFKALGYWFTELAPSEYPRPQGLVGRWPKAQRAAVVAHLQRGVVFERYRGFSYCRFGCGIEPRALGNCDLFDGTWVWPSGLAHYVEAHNVRLPDEFVEHVKQMARSATGTGRDTGTRRDTGTDKVTGRSTDTDTFTVTGTDTRTATGVPLKRPRQREGTVDVAPWLAWARSRGAVPAIAPWQLPPWEARCQLEAQAVQMIDSKHPLSPYWSATQRSKQARASQPSKQHPILVLGRRDTGAAVFALPDGQLAIVALGKPRAPSKLLAGWHAWPMLRR